MLGLGLYQGAQAWACEKPLGRLVSWQGDVRIGALTKVASSASVTLDQPICPSDLVTTGKNSRAAVMLHDRGMVRLKENSSLGFEQQQADSPWLLKLLDGWLYFLSPRPVELEIHTPYLNAGVRGTEFNLFALNDRGSGLKVWEGRVEAYNPQGSLLVSSGQSAYALPGEAPRYGELKINLPDMVTWILHYPPVLDTRTSYVDAPELNAAMELYRQNRFAGAIGKIESLSVEKRGSRGDVLAAGMLLSVGLADRASAYLDKAEAASADALALKAIILLSMGDRPAALKLAQQAASNNPGSPVPHIAMSYALQASFELNAALGEVEQALKLTPKNALAWSRLAELRLSLGDYADARQAAEKAVELAPNLERGHTVLGFAQLLADKTGQAMQSFNQGMRLDSTTPLPRLGRGLGLIRQGELEKGLDELEIAVALDPENALNRSYLGKAYFELDLEKIAAKELERSKQLDSQDPTPWLYQAFVSMAENQPVPALQQLRRSMALNEQRAVYRSRLLLDSDQAVRSTSLGRVYEVLGFDQQSALQASRSLQREPGNYSAHQLLADANRNRPRREIAHVSEQLQAQLRAPRAQHPGSARDAESRLNRGGLSDALEPALNEYSRMFQRDGVNLTVAALAGTQDSFAEEVLLSAAEGPFSLAATQYHSKTEGYRYKHYQRQNYWSLLGQYNLTPDTRFQVEYRNLDYAHGEQFWAFDPNDYFDDDIDDQVESWMAGFHHVFNNTWNLSSFYRHEDAVSALYSSDGSFDSLADESGDQFDVQLLGRLGWMNLSLGAGRLERDRLDAETYFGDGPYSFPSDLTHENLYVYAGFSPLLEDPRSANALITLGFSWEDYDDHDLFSFSKMLPKLGALWDLPVGADALLTLRAAYFETLKRALVANQTLEPTSVAGFNQFYDEPHGTWARFSGVGMDVDLPRSRMTMGVELYMRDLDLLGVDFDVFQATTYRAEEQSALVYLNWTGMQNWSLGIDYEYEVFDRDTQSAGPEGIVDVTTHRVGAKIRYFHPSGLRLSLEPTWINQDGVFANRFCDPFVCPTYPGSDRFWILDATVSYQIPQRKGKLFISAKNLLDTGFNYQDTDPFQPRYAPELTILAGVSLFF